MDALRLIAQNQIGGVLIRFAEPLRQLLQLLACKAAAVFRQTEKTFAQPQDRPGCAAHTDQMVHGRDVFQLVTRKGGPDRVRYPLLGAFSRQNIFYAVPVQLQ